MARAGSAQTGKRRRTFRDESGRTLLDYPRPSVAVDVALLTLVPADDGYALSVLEVRRVGETGWVLPGTFLRDGERLAEAALRALAAKAGVTGLSPRQLQVFDAPDRDDRGWVLSVAHVDACPLEGLEGRADATRLVSADSPGRLPYGHGDIVARAVADLRDRYLYAPDPDGFLPESFTLRELRQVHESVAGYELQRDTFRRAMEPSLASTGEVSVGGRGRPAELYTRA
ncbi:ADP-ribose pyrophosphatase YjhB, NUDIX family [Jatrophihabitans endophyticus]|uniref:ADP-ribose pyrophosphatase YjhB, NUDIX family n=1 Tax=Jatrophihabitans endophyticus TaxID=1206085 RepID=A0A1M5P8E6_9ACTN|nr:NUDIX domain-containing protein [Jatrophihabitans endophyticus]SHG98066.1 ADP-ribose pyrophosphatase YjhB, NUDIX family [Jatrophihabitans endophyticus]